MPDMRSARATLAVWKFSSCDGCQLTPLNCESELLAIAASVDIANFPEASREILPGSYDISLVEGSVATPEDERRVKRVRQSSRYLDTLRTSTPVAAHVQVDYELRGGPIDKGQLLEVIAAFTADRGCYGCFGPAAGWELLPLGLLYHRYTIGGDGTITDAKIVPPTSQNQRAVEADLADSAAPRLSLPREQLTRECEQAVRNYDPCISCATHFLDLRVREV